MSWLVKRKHYAGGESVIGQCTLEETAHGMAEDYNRHYQTDNYYVEEYADEKFDWPGNAKVEAILKRLR